MLIRSVGATEKRNLVTELAGRTVEFSLEQARLALPYVAAIVRDAADAFGEVQRLRQAAITAPSDAVHEQTRDQALARLNHLIDECNAVGVDLIRISEGLIRFNSSVEGRPVSLIWRLGDPIAGAWPDLAGA